MDDFKSLILEFERLCTRDSERGYFCQCGTEKMLKRLHKPETMRAFLLVAVLIDQLVYTHYSDVYLEFAAKYRVPKLHAHGVAAMASPSWFIYSRHGYDKNIDWTAMNAFAAIIVAETKAFLGERLGAFDSTQFEKALIYETETEFEKQHQKQLLCVFHIDDFT